MVSSSTKKIISLAISLLVVVISLTGVALGATVPTVSSLSRYTPGFSGAPGKMARDAAGNFYVVDFWGKGIVKLDRSGAKIGFIATNGRPSAVAVLPDSRLVVAIQSPQTYVAFYSQLTGAEISQFTNGSYPAPYRPSGIAVDAQGYIYVIDAGDSSNNTAANYGRVRVYSPAGACVYAFGARTYTDAGTQAGLQFKQPAGIAYEKASNRIMVVDTLNSKIKAFKTYTEDPTCAQDTTKTVGVPATEKGNGGNYLPTLGVAARLWNPVDIAFEYNGAALYRMYIAERGHNEIAVVNGDTVTPPYTTYGVHLKSIDSTIAAMKLPSAVLFEKTSTGGVLYTNNAPTATAANILPLSIDSGAVPVPVVTLTMAAVPTSAPSGSLSLSGTVSLANNPVNCSVNGGSDTLITPTGNNWNGSVTIVNGPNYILCKSASGGVTTYKEAITYGSPSNPAPVVTIAQPSGAINSKDATVQLIGTVNVPNSTISISNDLAGFDGSTLADAAGNWSAVVTLAEGSNVIDVTGFYEGSLVSDAVSRTVVADYTAPSGTISFLANSATTINAVQNIDGIVTDANLGSIEVNGAVVPSSARVALSATDTYFSVPVTLGRGSNTVTVAATDLVGRTSTIGSRTVTFNPDLPGLTVALPADNSFLTTGGTAAASGTAATSFTAINASNGCSAALTPDAGGNWSTASMTVASSFNSCQFTASGGGNQPVSEKRTINAAGGYAQLAITSPAADFATNSSSVPISGSVAPGSPAPTISIDGVAGTLSYDSGTGIFNATASLSTQGTHSVKVTANAATAAVRNLIYDTTPPAMSILANANATPFTIKGTLEPSAKMTAISAKQNGADISIPLSVLSYATDPATGAVVWTANLNGYPYDKTTLKFTAVDPAGNQKVMFFKSGKPTGDVNIDGKVRLDDALATLRHVAGTDTLTGESEFQADVGSLVEGHAAQDGSIDITDAVLILNKSYDLVSF